MDPDFLWHSLGGSAVVAATLTFARLLLEYAERRRGQQRDAEARLERILQDRLADADRRLERCEQDVSAERLRCATLEHEYLRLQQAHGILKDQYASLQADHQRLVQQQARPASCRVVSD
jgi:predicted nuclease with TOPRIM domain